jgi:hypothetical protein
MMWRVLENRPEIDLVYADSYVTWDPMSYDQFIERHDGEDLKLGRWDDEPGVFVWPDWDRSYMPKMCFMGPMPMWRANLHQKHGLFTAEYRVAGDYEFWLRCSNADNFYHIPMALGLYLARPDGVELSNMEAAYNESGQAVLMNQYPDGMDIEPMPMNGLVRVSMGPNWIFTDRRDLIKALEDM